jgi:hypothetical protein
MKTAEELVDAARDIIDKIAAFDDPIEALEDLDEYLADILHVCHTIHEVQEQPKEYQG